MVGCWVTIRCGSVAMVGCWVTISCGSVAMVGCWVTITLVLMFETTVSCNNC